jgi:tetratricopeptide (TPR) repeat protein
MVTKKAILLMRTALLAVALIPGLAYADVGELLIRKGVEARRAGKDQEALGHFRQAYELLHSPRSAAQLGLCENALADWVHASTHLTEALEATSDVWVSGNRSTITKALRDTQKHLVHVVVTGTPEGTDVFVNGETIGKLPSTVPAYV